MRDCKKVAAVVLAGGRGSRMQSDIPKQYMELCGYPVIYYSLKVFEESFVDEIILVCGKGDEKYCIDNIINKYDFKKITRVIEGGKERYHSVMNGLCAIKDCDIVFIHDGARPFVNSSILDRAFDDTVMYGNAVVAVPAKDTVKISDDKGFVTSTPDRSLVWMMQTPQTFYYKDIVKAYEQLINNEEQLLEEGIKITDDAMVMEKFSEKSIKLCMGDYRNIKITTPEDILTARSYLEDIG